jgi:hypothetical protein
VTSASGVSEDHLRNRRSAKASDNTWRPISHEGEMDIPSDTAVVGGPAQMLEDRIEDENIEHLDVGDDVRTNAGDADCSSDW